MTDYSCPTCGGQGESLGTLGFLHWLRCRACGMDYSVKVEALDEEMQLLLEEEPIGA